METIDINPSEMQMLWEGLRDRRNYLLTEERESYKDYDQLMRKINSLNIQFNHQIVRGKRAPR